MIKVRRSYLCYYVTVCLLLKKSYVLKNSLNLFQQQFWYLPSTFWARTCCICLFLNYFQLLKKNKKLIIFFFFFNNCIIFFISFSFTPHFSILPIFTSQFSLINSHITWALAALPASWRDIQSGVLPIMN